MSARPGYWIIPITDQLRDKVQTTGLPLFQRGPQRERGLFDPDTNQIFLTPRADLSTFLHESGHFFLEIMRDLATTDSAVRSDLSILEAWAKEQGAKTDRDIHERFASGFETYLAEGKAPTPELQGMFARFKSWLMLVYRNIERIFATNDLEAVELSDEVRGVMDRLLATDDAINAETAQAYGPMPMQAIGLSPREANDYQRIVNQADDEAKEQLTAKAMAELKRDRENWWKQGAAREADKIRETMNEQPEYRARDHLSGDRVDEEVGPMKLDSAYIRDIYGTAAGRRLNRMTAQGGEHPDALATLFGYTTGDALVKALLGTMNKSDREDYVQAQAQEAMRQKHGDMFIDGTLGTEAAAVVRNDKQAERLLLELKFLNRSTGKPETPRQYFKAMAESVVRDTPVDQIRPDIHRRNEIKARQNAVKLAAEGNYEAAAVEQHKAVRQFYLYREATNAKRKADGHRARLAQMKKTKYSARQVHPDYLQQLKVLIAAFDLRKNPKDSNAMLASVQAFVDAQSASAPDLIAGNILDEITSWRTMTLTELSAVRDAAENLLKVGKANSDQEKAVFKAEMAGLEANIIDKTGKPREPESERSLVSRWRKGWSEFFSAEHRKLESFVQELDGWEDNGPFAEAFFRDLWGATINEIERGFTEHANLEALFDGFEYLFNGFKDSLQDIEATRKYVDLHAMPHSNGDIQLSRGERIVLALN